MEYAVGQEVVMEPLENAAYFHRGPLFGTVIDIKRKYIYVMRDEPKDIYRFNKGTLQYADEINLNYDFRLFPSKEAYESDLLYRRMAKEVSGYFSSIYARKPISTEAMNQVFNILKAEGVLS